MSMNCAVPEGAMVTDLPDLVLESNKPTIVDAWDSYCQAMCHKWFPLVLKAQAVYREDMIEELNR